MVSQSGKGYAFPYIKKNPGISRLNAEDKEELESNPKGCFNYKVQATTIGATVRHQVLGIKFEEYWYHCSEDGCHFRTQYKGNLQRHYEQSHSPPYSKEEIQELIKKEQPQSKQYSTGPVVIYYEIIDPHEMLPIPGSVEIDERITTPQKVPTPMDRVAHDEAARIWRGDMGLTATSIVNGKPAWQQDPHDVGAYQADHSKAFSATLKVPIKIPGTNRYDFPGLSGNYWYIKPEIWSNKAGWVQVRESDIPKWDLLPKKRWLYLVGYYELDQETEGEITEPIMSTRGYIGNYPRIADGVETNARKWWNKDFTEEDYGD
jgi:hypothetical protein